jgi:hypothetical protein
MTGFGGGTSQRSSCALCTLAASPVDAHDPVWGLDWVEPTEDRRRRATRGSHGDIRVFGYSSGTRALQQVTGAPR